MRKIDGKPLACDGVSSISAKAATFPIYAAQAEDMTSISSLSKPREDPNHNWIKYWIDLGGEG